MKRVKILRGVSGSGKSTYAQSLVNMPMSKRAYGSAVVCSADDFFMEGGEYKFDVTKITEAHSVCFRKFLGALVEDTELVIVDNTNTTAWEISPYMLAGQSFGYDVTVVEVYCDSEVAADRSTHGVPREEVLAMAARMAGEKLPPHWKVERWHLEG